MSSRRLLAQLGVGVWLLSPAALWAASAGSTGADFLHFDPGARSAAMSGAYAAVGNDGESLFFNPAGMSEPVNPQMLFSHLAWWEGVSYDSVWGVQPLGDLGAVGAALSFLNVPPFNSTQDSALASDSAWGLAGRAGYAGRWGRCVAVGGALNVLRLQLATEGSWGISLDAGLKYFLNNGKVVLAAQVQNVGMLGAFASQADSPPLQFGGGAGFQILREEWLKAAVEGDVRATPGDRLVFSLGTEAWLGNVLALRAGVNNGTDTGDWLTCGLGVCWRKIHLDYALKPLGLLGAVHQLSVGYDFGQQARLDPPQLRVRLISRQVVYPDGEPGKETDFVPTCKIPAGVESWELHLTDRTGHPVRQYAGTQSLPLRITWDGKDAEGKRADLEGFYLYALQVTDRRGFSDEERGEILPISITRLPQLKALPRDIFAGRVTFNPKGSENAVAWSIDIVGPEGQVLRKYQGVGAFPKDFAWDGKDENNRSVSVREGFHYLLQVRDQAGNEIKSIAPLAQIDAGTKAYAPTAASLPEQVVFRFRLQPEIKFKGWSFDVVDAISGKVVRTYSGDGHPPDSLAWDACNEQGQPVSLNQKFSYVLRLQDLVGNVWQQAADMGITPVMLLPQPPEGETWVKLEEILFEFNKAELQPGIFDKLHKAADLIKAGAGRKLRVLIEGHTDEIGDDAFNYDLSLSRAHMVMRYLVEEEKVPSELLEVKGLGKSVPLVLGTDPQILAKNRRVEITLIISK
ncbi:MAG: OmpA family protein [Candidatus Firestonebacteria bacterium]|nr:OmpA family protein [Candidatus Firestonebacteria bacterium]